MSAKKDKKGRVLRTGESQRKDLTYDHAEQSMQKILQFQLPEKVLKSG